MRWILPADWAGMPRWSLRRKSRFSPECRKRDRGCYHGHWLQFERRFAAQSTVQTTQETDAKTA